MYVTIVMNKTIQESNYEYFMQTDVSRYIGEWIAIYEEKVISHGKSLKEVTEKAKELSGGKRFLLVRVPSEEAMIF